MNAITELCGGLLRTELLDSPLVWTEAISGMRCASTNGATTCTEPTARSPRRYPLRAAQIDHLAIKGRSFQRTKGVPSVDDVRPTTPSAVT
jgi:hypothetical protein